eukprot:scaffold2702_cov168-Amphora_coffeaeformis.AAC.8
MDIWNEFSSVGWWESSRDQSMSAHDTHACYRKRVYKNRKWCILLYLGKDDPLDSSEIVLSRARLESW